MTYTVETLTAVNLDRVICDEMVESCVDDLVVHLDETILKGIKADRLELIKDTIHWFLRQRVGKPGWVCHQLKDGDRVIGYYAFKLDGDDIVANFGMARPDNSGSEAFYLDATAHHVMQDYWKQFGAKRVRTELKEGTGAHSLFQTLFRSRPTAYKGEQVVNRRARQSKVVLASEFTEPENRSVSPPAKSPPAR